MSDTEKRREAWLDAANALALTISDFADSDGNVRELDTHEKRILTWRLREYREKKAEYFG